MACYGRTSPQALPTSQVDNPSLRNKDESSNANKKQLDVTIETADNVFEYLQEYGVLVCRVHGYAVRDLGDHLRRQHRVRTTARKAIVAYYAHYRVLEPAQVALPPPLQPPFDCLGLPKRAYICDEIECDELSISHDAIRKHCNKAHGWKSTPGQRTYWHEVWVQTFFNAAGLQRYFTVDYSEPLSESEEEGSYERGGSSRLRSANGDPSQVQSIIQQWDQGLEKQKKDLEIADAETAKTDHTAWFKRNEWPEHLAKCNLRYLSRISRLPDKEERLLQRVVELNTALVEKCVAGLSSLDRETRRWLRSAKLSEPDQRPLARLQNASSQQTYATYMARFACYSLRVLQSCKDAEKLREADEGSDNDSDSSSDSAYHNDSSDSEASSTADTSDASGMVVDVYKDARRLYPWHGEQQERLVQLQQSIEHMWAETAQRKALLNWYQSIIFQRVRGNTFTSALLHFLAILGINEETFRLRDANDFSYMLAGVVYCTRVFSIEIVLPLEGRLTQDEADDRRFRQIRDNFLADGTYSVVSKMLSLLAYSKSIALSHSNAGTTGWEPNRKGMWYRGQLISLARFRKMVCDVLDEATDQLWANLMWTKRDDRFDIPLDKLEDDVTFTKRGVSFVTNPRNGLTDKRGWMLAQAFAHPEGRQLRPRDSWATLAVLKYLRQVDRFRELLLFLVHVTGGQPARGSEITTIRSRNGFLQDRNVFVMAGQIVIVTRYHKSQSQYDKPKVIPRFLPWGVGQLLAVYLAYVQPLEQHLSEEVRGYGYSDYMWSNEYGPWATDRLTKVISRETQKGIGVRLTTLDYRHVAISIGREVIGNQFAKGYIDEAGEVEEAEMDEDDGLEISAGRSGKIGANRYGVSLDVIRHLSSRSIDIFRPLSGEWHTFLGLLSFRQAAGQKRGAHLRSESSSISSEQQQQQRRLAVLLQNNGIHEWAEMVARYGQRASASYSSPPLPSEINSGVCSSPQVQRTPQVTSTPAIESSSSAIGGMEASPLWHRSQAVVTRPPERRVISEEELQTAMRKALGSNDVRYRSVEQRQALHAIVSKDDSAPLVIVLPTGGGKSLLFTAPACLEDPGVTVVVVPYRALINDLLDKARQAGIDCMEWKHSEVNPATLVFVSADQIVPFMSYAQIIDGKGLLRRVFVDESHLTFTASDWRPKLEKVRLVRGLRVPTIMLTATLPTVLEFELEASMAAQFAQYIRAITTRVRTRYTVDMCPAGSLWERTIDICRRMKEHLRSQRGIVYSRSRRQCESLAQELQCAYYHAGAVDNRERLDRWLQYGGLVVATSALGAGVDFPAVVLTLHVDVPYGMIDFAQESGRAGRAGEDVDSIVVVEEGRVEALAEVNHSNAGLDQYVMGQYITARGCRRLVMSRYLDGQEIDCSSDGVIAQCDRCSSGRTELERQSTLATQQRQAFEEQMDEVATGCAACWVTRAGTAARPLWHTHRRADCTQHTVVEEGRGTFAGVRFTKDSHSCFRCGLSQKLCQTGQSEVAACQWPSVMRAFITLVWQYRPCQKALEEAGWTGSWDESDDRLRQAWLRWMGQRHRRLIWGEGMSNAMVGLIKFGQRVPEYAGAEQTEPVEEQSTIEARVTVEVGASIHCGQNVRERIQRGFNILDSWAQGCMICRAYGDPEVQGHHHRACLRTARVEGEVTVMAGVFNEFVRRMEAWSAPDCEQGGRCWVNWRRCQRGRYRTEDCRWSTVAIEIISALVLPQTETQPAIQAWMEREGFVNDGDGSVEGQWRAMGHFLGQARRWGDVESNMLCDVLEQFG